MHTICTMSYFLAKSDPETYSIEQLEKDGTTIWDGVHNFTAINNIKKMKKGDFVYFYQSQTDKAIVGLMEVVSEPYKNEKDPRNSWAVDVKFVKKYSNIVTLADFKAEEQFKNFDLLRLSRLSVMEVPPDVQKWIEKRVS